MQRSQVEDEAWTDVAIGAVFMRPGSTPGTSIRHWPAVCWGISCVVHLLLLVAVGVLTRHIVDVPPAPPIRVSILPTIETSAQLSLAEDVNATPQPRMPERHPLASAALSQVAPVESDPIPAVTPRPTPMAPERAVASGEPSTITPEWLEVMPEVGMSREPPPLIERPKEVLPSRLSPKAITPVAPLAPSPPVVAREPAAHLPQSPPARELPKRGRPPTTVDDAVVARVPPAGQSTRDAPTATASEAHREEWPTPQASLPQSTNARYGQNPAPAYPSEARRRGWEGTVLLAVEILENGRPNRTTIKQSSGHPILDEAAQGTVGRWTFIPAQRDGKPVKSVAEVPIVFRLRNGR
jgi:periplasmic protein TonB